MGEVFELHGPLNSLLSNIAERAGEIACSMRHGDSRRGSETTEVAKVMRAVDLSHRTITSWFADTVSRTPDQVALSDDDGDMTFAELDRASSGLAALLADAGCQSEDVVAIAVNRGRRYVIGILAVLKAGGAFLPLDHRLPAIRWQAMAMTAQACLAVTDAANVDKLRAACPDINAVSADDVPPRQWAPRSIHPGSLAYVMTTSGTEGAPKCVMVEHRAVCHYLSAAWDAYIRVDHSSRVLQLTSYGFDGSLRDILGGLVHGAQVVLLSEQSFAEPLSIIDAINDRSITHLLSVTPTTVSAILDAAAATGATFQLRQTLISGEPARILARHRGQLSMFGELINHYGSTESTMTAVWARVDDDGSLDVVGAPLPGVRTHIYDAAGRSVTGSRAGELHIGGQRLARGYLNDARLTAERFLPEPDSPEPGTRMYRTGDVARTLPAGIEYLGRIDRQIKVNGQRVEPAEIEAVFQRHGAVRTAIVAMVAQRSGAQPTLAACIAVDQPLSAADLRLFAATELPAHLIPTAIYPVDSLPRNANGKLDWPKVIASAPPSVGSTTATPVTGTPLKVLEVWAAVIDNPDVELDVGLYDLGGNSLTATAIAARLAGVFGVRILAADVLECATARRLAGLIDRRVAESAGATTARDAAPEQLTTGELQMYLLDSMAEDAAENNVPYAVRVHGIALHHAALVAAIDATVRDHEALRTTYQMGDDGPRAVVGSPDTRVQTHIFAGVDSIAAAQQLIVELAREPFDLSTDLPLRAAVVALGAADWVLALVAHHIAVDADSFALILRSIRANYLGTLTGSPAQLPTSGRADLAGIAAKDSQRAAAYWRHALTGVAAFEISVGRPRPPALSSQGGRRYLRFSPGLGDAVGAAASACQTTRYVILLAALHNFLSERSGQDTGLVGTAVSTRSMPAGDRIVGYFVNTVPVILRGGGANTREHVAATKSSLLSSLTHAELPFAEIVDAADDRPRDPSRQPLCQIYLTYQEDPKRHLAIDGAQVTELEIDPGYSTHDITILVADDGPELRGYIEYRTQLYTGHEADDIANEYGDAIERLVHAVHSERRGTRNDG